jgi:hypothetical protein
MICGSAAVGWMPTGAAQSGHVVFPSVSLARIARKSSVPNDCSSAVVA